MLLFFISCNNTKQKVNFQESDKTKIFFEKDILAEQLLVNIEIKNNKFEKVVDKKSEEITYKYESELWKKNKLIGSFASSYYVYPFSNIDEMEIYFLAYIVGHKYGEVTTPNFRYERNNRFKLPYKEYQVYEIIVNDSISFGYNFNILKDNKIIFISIIIKDKFKIEIDKITKRIDEI
ncbi:hypothetical protein [Tenacibaculum sp. Bg11-29]|uniref:hypothetical protein n=1 Tax=Tenacibaculum sp. Bg11-29 TaxID=2058306 RepID=UPI0018E3D662|nr:hypothetical protein [Tenacibaculum sp. Bg11-29]